MRESVFIIIIFKSDLVFLSSDIKYIMFCFVPFICFAGTAKHPQTGLVHSHFQVMCFINYSALQFAVSSVILHSSILNLTVTNWALNHEP